MGEGSLRERGGEIEALQEALHDRPGATGRLVVIEGPPGIGKSRLLTEAAGLAARQGTTVLAARGGEAEQGFAFGVALQLLEAPLAAMAPAVRDEVLAGPAALAAPLLTPGTSVSATGAEGFQLVHGLYWLLANMADRGALAVLVDEVQWADAPSVQLLRYLAHRLDEVPVTVVLAVGMGAADEDETLATLLAEASGPVLLPPPLSCAATADLVREIAFPEAGDEFCSAVAAAGGGNPQLLLELLRALEHTGGDDVETVAVTVPEPVLRSTRGRLRRFGEDEVLLARAAAVLGPDVRLTHAARLARIEHHAAATAAARLVAGGVLASADPLTFTAPLLAAAVRAGIPAASWASSTVGLPVCCTGRAPSTNGSPRSCCTRRPSGSRGS